MCIVQVVPAKRIIIVSFIRSRNYIFMWNGNILCEQIKRPMKTSDKLNSSNACIYINKIPHEQHNCCYNEEIINIQLIKPNTFCTVGRADEWGKLSLTLQLYILEILIKTFYGHSWICYYNRGYLRWFGSKDVTNYFVCKSNE